MKLLFFPFRKRLGMFIWGFLSIFFVASWGFVDAAYCSQKEIIFEEFKYNVGDGENITVATDRSKKEAVRKASERAGVFVKSYSKVSNYVLTDDQVEFFSANVLKVEVIDIIKSVENNCFFVTVKIKAEVSKDNIDALLANMKSKSIFNDYKQELNSLVELNKSQSKEIENLKRQLSQIQEVLKTSTSGEEKAKAKAMVGDNEKRYLSTSKFNDALSHFTKNGYENAIALLSESIRLNTDNAAACLLRGRALLELSSRKQGIKVQAVTIVFDFMVEYYKIRMFF
ncbi:MAG: hypothetical protein WCO26_18760, partial [Deltaproteobacteria bacterium]